MKFNVNISRRIHNFDQSKICKDLAREEATDHPLKPLVVSMGGIRNSKRFLGSSFDAANKTRSPAHLALDPLGVALDGTDPLSLFMQQDLDPLSDSTHSVSIFISQYYITQYDRRSCYFHVNVKHIYCH